MHIGRTSVVIPVWNRPHTIGSTLRSVCIQRADLEILVVDNASDDPDTLQAAVARVGDDRIRVVRLGQNLGPAGGRNAGVAAATGEFVAFVDSDDTVEPTWLERSLDGLADPNAVGAVSALRKQRPDGTTIAVVRPTPQGALFGHMVGRFGGPPTFVLRRSVFDEVGGFDERFWYGENIELWVRVAALCVERGWTISSIDEVLSTFVTDDARRRYDRVRLESVELMLEKHAALLASDRAAHGDLLAVGGVTAAGLGNLQGARTFFARALRVQPSSRSVARWLIAAVPPLARRRWPTA